MPRVEVRPKHHDLVGLVRSGNLADDVERGRIVIEGVLDLQVDPHRLVLLQRAEDAPVVLDGDRHPRYRLGRVRLARAAAADKHRAARPLTWREDGEDALIFQELRPGLGEAGRRSTAASGEPASSSASAAAHRVGLSLEVAQLIGGVALRLRFEERGDLAHGGHEEDLPLQLAFPGGEVLSGVERCEDGLTRHRAVRARRPRLWIADDRQAAAGRGGHHVELVVRPAAAERTEGLELHVDQAPGRHLLDRPVAGLAESRRVREPRTVDVGQPAHDLHDA